MNKKQESMYEVVENNKSKGFFFETSEIAGEFMKKYAENPNDTYIRKRIIGPVYKSVEEFEEANSQFVLEKSLKLRERIIKSNKLPFSLKQENANATIVKERRTMGLVELRNLVSSLSLVANLQNAQVTGKIRTNIDGVYMNINHKEYEVLATFLLQKEMQLKALNKKIAVLSETENQEEKE